MPTREQMENAAYKRWRVLIGTLHGMIEGLEAFPVERAVAKGTAEDVTAWDDTIVEAVTCLGVVRDAMQDAAEERFEEFPVNIPHVFECVECGETFDAERSDAMYCSAACRQRAYRKRQQAGGL